MIEKWRESLDEAGAYEALLTDLSKSFDCLPYELIIAKLYGYGVDMPPLKLINSHLSKRRQMIKINDVHISSSETFWGTSGLHSWSIIIQYIHMWPIYVPTQKWYC